ncbi:hypothetical protein CFOL_v3_32452 [Cephalotus follicularis]|uniref:Uncharacterized protein n=1 Tax=Cephalotus follicularis TaxID=3775 RepID=A0A1Q3D9B6_CEPFO|nr:hypothetical protein CFOL_v3_32452 [Cephalotus follicularis]
MGGGRGAAGGGMLRTVGRAVTRAGVNLQEPLSSSSSTTSTSTSTTPTATVTSPNGTLNKSTSFNGVSLSSGTGSCSLHNLPVSSNTHNPNWPDFGPSSPCCEQYEWVSVDDGGEDETTRGHGSYDDFVLGPVPSLDEVHDAVSALEQVFDSASYSQRIRDKYGYNMDKDLAWQLSNPTDLMSRVSSNGSELDWLEPPSLHLSNSRMLQPYGYGRVYDALHLLQTEPTVQRMVISLSSDRAVWDAVLNNEVVRELRELYFAADSNNPESSDETQTSNDSNPAMNFIMWIFNNTKVKFMELIEKITTIATEMFKPHEEKKTGGAIATATDSFEEKLRTSFLLSVVVLLVVVVTRGHSA